MLRATFVAVFITSLIAADLSAQKARPQSGTGPIELSVKKVTDTRGEEFFERLELIVELVGVPAADLSAARVLLRSAVDDTGRNLLDDDAEEPGMESIEGSYSDDETGLATISFPLVSPARTASSVREISGEIELYMPSKDANSTASIPKFLSFKGKPLSHKTLKANGVGIALVSDQQFESEKKRLVELKRKEMISEGYSEDDISLVIGVFLEIFQPEPYQVVLKIKDPNNAIQSLSFVDASGEVHSGLLDENEGFMFLASRGGTPEPDWTLRVEMKTAKSLVRRPFVLTNVPLP